MRLAPRLLLPLLCFALLVIASHPNPTRAQDAIAAQRQHATDLTALTTWRDRYGPAPDSAVFDRLKQFVIDHPKDGRAMYWLSDIYLGGVNGVPQDLQLHMQLLIGASELRDARAQARLASYYLKGVGVTKDFKRAMELAIAAAAQLEPRGHAVLAEIYETGAGVEPSPGTAIQYYQQAANLNYDPALLGLGIAYIDGKQVNRDEAKGKQLILKAATNGMAQAQYHLAVLYLKGVDGKRDELQAAKWMLAASKQDFLPAVAAMGDILLMLDNTKQAEAVAWFRKAAEKGHPVGQRKYALALLAGQHVTTDVPGAVKWLEKAVEGGDAEAKETLGVLLMAGAGVKRDTDRAEILLTSAADAGRASAAMYLNAMKYKGKDGEF